METGLTLPEGLLADVKNYLNITWVDVATDQKVTNILLNGMAYLNGKYGGAADYSFQGLPRALLFDYARYGRDDALDVFENNFRASILAMQNEKAVSDFVESTEQAET